MNEADTLLMQAALDGEMDAPSLASFEQRLAGEPELARAYAQMKALRGALRAMPAPRAPDALRARAMAMAAPAPNAQETPTGRQPAARAGRGFANWGAIAATLAALGIGLGVGYTSAPRADIGREVLAGHLRGMISTHPVDVVSSDQHTVKPWFAGKIAVSPPTPDLAAQGFTLEGGRIDIIGGEPSPTLVYRAGKHTFSITRLPDGVASAASFPASIDGHALARWSAGGASYVATSDASAAEVQSLANAFRAAVERGS
ncbi:MAG TPA: anti-sigma factor [Rhodoblastus sp.]|nr:anti-sigma factor [Rhodoblastus sp.]